MAYMLIELMKEYRVGLESTSQVQDRVQVEVRDR